VDWVELVGTSPGVDWVELVGMFNVLRIPLYEQPSKNPFRQIS